MKTFGKIIGGIIVFIIVVIVGLNLYFTNQRLKDTVMPYLEEAVGRPVHVQEMSLSFFSTFPHPGIEIKQLSIPGESKSDTLLALNRLVVGVELFPLLSSQINITELVLEHPEFTYIIYADSTTNIDFLLSDAETDTSASSGYDINIPYFQISDGYLGYRDFTSATQAKLNDFDGELSVNYADSIQTNIDVKVGGFSLTVDSSQYVQDLPLSLSEQSVIYAEQELVKLKEGTFAIRGLQMDLTGTIADWSRAVNVDLQFNSSTDNFGALLKLVPDAYSDYTEGLETDGSLVLTGTIAGPVGGEKPPSFNVLVKVENGYMKDPDLPQPIENIQLAARATNELVTVQTLHAEAGANVLSGSGTLKKPLEENGAFSADFVADIDLSTINQFYDLSELGVQKLAGQLDVDATTKGVVAAPQNATFNGKAKLTNGMIKYKDVPKPIENINISATGSQKLLTIQSFDAQAGKNSISANGTIKQVLDEKQRTINMDTNLRFDLATLKNFYPIDEDSLQLKGLLTAQATLNGSAQRIAEAVESGSINLKNGFIDYYKIEKPLRDITLDAVLDGSKMIISEALVSSGDNSISATGVISNYLSEDRLINLQTTGSVELGQIQNYYELKPAITKLTGDARFELTMKGPANDPAAMDFSGQLTVKNASMQGQSLTAPVTGLNGTFTLAPNAATLKSLTFNIGSSDIKVSGSLQNYMQYLKDESGRTVIPHLTGQFSSRYLNVDELVDWSDTTSTFTLELPYLTSSVQAAIDKMVIHGVTMRNIEGRATTTPDQIKMTEAHANLFEGDATGTLLWQVPAGKPSTLHFKGGLDSLRLASFFKAYPILGTDSRFYQFISGTFSTQVDYTTKIDTELNPLIPTTALTGTFGMSKAIIENHPLQKALVNFVKIQQFTQVALDQWQSALSVENSVLHIKDLTLTSDDIGLELNGTQNLISDKIDFSVSILLPGRFKKTLAKVITGQAANALSRDNGTIMVPLRITGTYGAPNISLDKQIIQPMIKDYLKRKAGNVLQNLFGRDDKKQTPADTTAVDSTSP